MDSLPNFSFPLRGCPLLTGNDADGRCGEKIPPGNPLDTPLLLALLIRTS